MWLCGRFAGASGGHNLLEPAAWEKPVLTGPHLHNFTAIAQLLDDAGGLSVVDSGEALADKLQALMSDPDSVPGRARLLLRWWKRTVARWKKDSG